ncbi:hypothetical protein HY045_00050, partial [Candidatus Woesebacteria bacterium]|nr:hypothetical protein [Candidatus Woesebacteria bacterium]
MKYVIAALLGIAVTLLAVGIYIKFTVSNNTVREETVNQNQETPIPTPLPTLVSTPSPTSLPSPTPSGTGTITSAGGLLVFSKYSINTPLGWSVTKTQPVPQSEKLLITKSGYEISIYQAATGGSQCTYPGDSVPQGPSVSFAKFTELTTQSYNKLRRSQGITGFTVCELLQSSW